MESITLYFKEGSSDKVYQASLEAKDNGWVVNYAYGRRGSTFTVGTKTNQPESRETAQRIYDKLVKDKVAKGYSPGEDGTQYSESSAQDTGIRPQLLNPINEADVARFLADDDFLLQPKLDGRRLLIRKQGGEVTGINRKGLSCGIPESIRESALALRDDFLIDGEGIGDSLHVFDLLEWKGKDLRPLPFRRRVVELLNLLASGIQTRILWVPTYQGQREKTDAFALLRQEQTEGAVFKRGNAGYSAGRPASGGDQMKFKFVETASVVISAINARRSAAISVTNGTRMIPAGNVTIPPDHPIPQVGQVAEVRYLYAIPESGSLFQPVYLGERQDIDPGECLVDQLKYKQAA